MKKDMENRTYYCNTFQEVHAPKALAGKVINMTNHKKNNLTLIKKFAVTAASLVALFVGSNAIAYAATGSTWVHGFFKDIQRWDGAVVGTEYVTSAKEIEIAVSDRITENDNIIIPITIQFTDTKRAPFSAIDELALGKVTLTDNSGNEVSLSADSPNLTYAQVILGTAQINLTLAADKLQPDTEYYLHIESLYGSKKADAPLFISGDWNCLIK